MLLLFVKGDRGLVANYNGKFYFPDRKSNIKEEGLYECTITIEKPNYCFVKGELESTYIPNEKAISYYIENVLTRRSEAIYIKYVGESIVLFETTHQTLAIRCFEKDRQPVTITIISNNSSNILALYDPKRFRNVDIDIIKNYIEPSLVTITQSNYKDVIAHCIGCMGLGRYNKYIRTNISVYDFKYIVVSNTWMLSSYKDTFIISYRGDDFVDASGIFDIDRDFTGKTLNIDLSDIIDYMKNNHIGASPYVSADTSVYAEHVCLYGNTYIVKCINAKYLAPISDEDKEQVDKSWEEFRTEKKRIAKNLTRDSISEFMKATSELEILCINNLDV